MKKIFLFSIATTVALSAFAQHAKSSISASATRTSSLAGDRIPAAKTTAVGDVDTLGHIFSSDTLALYYTGSNADSGFRTGMNAFGDKGYAERYDVNFLTTSAQVTGVMAFFTGTVNPASTKTVKFYSWSAAPQSPNGLGANFFNSGLPGTKLDSVTVPITALGISTVAGGNDTIKAFTFTTPSPYISNFYVGYTINYNPTAMGGDTIAVLGNLNGERHTQGYRVVGTDTIINNQNAVMFADGTWGDLYTEGARIANHLFLFPIITVGTAATSVEGVTRNNLTIFGNYPNPAANATNIKFSVAKATEVTISVTDMAGKVVKTISEKYTAGTQIVELNTSSLPSGEYIYLIRTAEGDGMASKMSVIK